MFDTTSTDVALDTIGTRNTAAVDGQAEALQYGLVSDSGFQILNNEQ